MTWRDRSGHGSADVWRVRPVVLLLAALWLLSATAMAQGPTTAGSSAASGLPSNAPPPVVPAARPVAPPPSPASSASAASAAPAAPAAPAASAGPTVGVPVAPHTEPPDAGLSAIDASVDASEPADAADMDAVQDVREASPDVVENDGGKAGAMVEPASSASSSPPPAGDSPSPVTEAPPVAAPSPGTMPLWNIFPVMPDRDSDGIMGQLLPKLGLGDRGSLFGYTVLLLLSVLVAYLAGKGRKKLPSRGVLPRILSGVHIGMRTVVVLFGLVLLANWIPPSYAPVLLWVALAAAAAAGWSARDFLPDIFAGVVILVERRIRPGTWISGSGYVGEVQSLGPRAAKLRDHEGRTLAVPNRKLLAGPVAVDHSLHPSIEVRLKVAEGIKTEEARQIIEDAALLSPWRVLLHRPEVFRDAQDPRAWRVRIRLIEPRFLAAFESALLDHVEQSLRVREQAPTATGHPEMG